jgi:hypothetical protein
VSIVFFKRFLLSLLCLALGLMARSPLSAQTTSALPDPPRVVPTDHLWAGSTDAVTVARDRFPYIIAFRPNAAVARTGLKEFTVAELAQLAFSKHAGLLVFGETVNGLVPITPYSLGTVWAIIHDKSQLRDTTTDVSVVLGDIMLIGTPSIETLPREVRDAAADYMRTTDHVEDPKIAMIVRKAADGTVKPGYIVAPNLPRSGFDSDEAWNAELKRIEWFLPPTVIAIRPPREPLFDTWFRNVKVLDAK